MKQCAKCPKPAEADRYELCYDCWWKADKRNPEYVKPKVRNICAQHIHHAKIGKSQFLTGPDKCNICRYLNRPKTLADLARMFENAAMGMRFAHENPGYDPHGISWSGDVEKAMKTYLENIHPDYRKNVLKSLNEVK